MSLVNEALKKARMEASRQEALRRGIPLPPPSFFAPRQRRPLWPWVALAVTALIALAGLGFWAGQRSVREATLAQSTGGKALAGSSTAAEEKAGTESRPQPTEPRPPATAATPPSAAAVTAPALSATPTPGSVPSAAQPEPTTAPSASASSSAAVSEPQPAPPAPRPARTTPPAQPAVPTYVEVADLPGGRLELGGIAWSKSDPHALINGRILGRGERVESYRIVDIQPRQVELTGDRGSFILRLR
jgi:hypothetical protein